MTALDQITIAAAAGCLMSLLAVVVAAFADWPAAPRHRGDDDGGPRLLGGIDPTPPGPWIQDPPPIGRYIAATRPLTPPDPGDGIPPLIVDSPPGALGRLPAQGLLVERRPTCRLCWDGVDVVGDTCLWCGCRPVMQP